jgi:hypothetical protein
MFLAVTHRPVSLCGRRPLRIENFAGNLLKVRLDYVHAASGVYDVDAGAHRLRFCEKSRPQSFAIRSAAILHAVEFPSESGQSRRGVHIQEKRAIRGHPPAYP